MNEIYDKVYSLWYTEAQRVWQYSITASGNFKYELA